MKETKITSLAKNLDKAAGIDEKKLADEIKAIGFKCQKCARCCMAEYGDNTVSVFPFEIRRICEKTGLMRDELVIPTPSEDRDSQGNIHTFEWVLRKNGDCIFLEKGLCRIYECRPFICKTYPFYLLDGRLMVSECEGIGGDITEEDSRKLASLLKERYIAEIKEAIALFERFRGFAPSGNGICVHDSGGEHWV
ncbi:MAG: YkgJ family cysteine cluster protein [Candidatus Methanoperedens sp.]